MKKGVVTNYEKLLNNHHKKALRRIFDGNLHPYGSDQIMKELLHMKLICNDEGYIALTEEGSRLAQQYYNEFVASILKYEKSPED